MVAQAWARERVSELRLTGSVLEWRGHFGWIEPDGWIDHPEAARHGRRVYVSAKDVGAGTELYGGVRVSFLAYADGNGVGAEDVQLEAALAGAFPAYPVRARPRAAAAGGRCCARAPLPGALGGRR
ncbi:unnamed protein product, partial [Prorocentrum cordatum]